jgi:hypothetical protein
MHRGLSLRIPRGRRLPAVAKERRAEATFPRTGRTIGSSHAVAENPSAGFIHPGVVIIQVDGAWPQLSLMEPWSVTNQIVNKVILHCS